MEEPRFATLQTTLDFAIDSTNSLFNICIGQPLDQIHDTLSIIAISFTSSDYHIDGGALARAKSDLNAMVVNSPIIANAFLYVPNADLVISSSYTSSNLSASIYYNIIWTYESGLAHLTSLKLCDGSVSMFQYGNEYIIVRDMYSTSDHKQSTLFLVLDANELNQYIKTSIHSGGNIKIFLYDSFGNQIPSTDPADLNNLFDFFPLPSNEETSMITEDDLFILGRQSSVTSFYYYLAVDAASIRPSFRSMIPMVVPFAILLFFIVCAIAIFATIFLYKPFHSVVAKLEESDLPLPEDVNARNEFEYLNNTITSIVNRQEHLQSMLHVVSRDVQLRLISNLINDGTSGSGNIINTLESIDSPFKINAIYVVIAIELAAFSETAQDNSSEIYGLVSDHMDHLSSKYDFCFELVEPHAGPLALVIQFNDINLSIVNGKHIIMSIKHDLAKLLSPKDLIESGHLYHSILDIGFSYAEASNAIASQKMLNRVANKSTEHAEPKQSENSLTTLLNHRVEQIIVSCQQGESAAIPLLVERTMNEINEATPDQSQLFQIFKELLNTMINQIVSCDYINLSMIPDAYSEFCQLNSTDTNSELMLSCAKESVLQLTNAFLEQLKKQKNPYIVATQEYIKNHYFEAELTLDNIASNVRISSSYLSKLFSNCLGIKLFEYLTRYRVDASVSILLDTRKTVSEIATLTGFTSSRNYIRAFKRYYNETPGEYRKSHSTDTPT